MIIRKSSRAIILNSQNKIFLFQYNFDYFAGGNVVWITPGGGLEEGETFDMALIRELYEELGIVINKNFKQIYYRHPVYCLKNGEKAQCEERFYLIHLDIEEFTFHNWTESEQERMKRGKWWSVDEIMQSGDEFFTSEIVDMLNNLIKGKIPDEPTELS